MPGQQADSLAGASLLYAPPQERAGNVVRLVNGTTGIISRFAGMGSGSSTGDGGLATAATLNSPRDVAYDPDDGSLYVTGACKRKSMLMVLPVQASRLSLFSHSRDSVPFPIFTCCSSSPAFPSFRCLQSTPVSGSAASVGTASSRLSWARGLRVLEHRLWREPLLPRRLLTRSASSMTPPDGFCS